MRINNNLMAMNTHRQLGINAGNGAKSIEKLSSGYRINRAGDDAAGLAISEKMRAQIRGLSQASRNSQDAISLVQTAEGALNETQDILQRMRELAVQSANDTNVTVDRGAIQNEIDQLTQEVDRIATTTEFNTRKLLNGGAGIQGTSGKPAVSITGGSANTKATGVTLQLDNVVAAKAATMEFTIDNAADLIGGSFVLNGTTITFANGADLAADQTNLVNAINLVSDTTGVVATDSAAGVLLTTAAVGATAKIDITGFAAVADEGANTLVSINGAAGANSADAMLAVGTNATAAIDDANSDNTVDTTAGAKLTFNGNMISVHGGAYDGLELKVAAGTTTTSDVDIKINVNGVLSMQIGANEGQDMSVSIGDMRATALGISAIDVTSSSSAKTSISTIQDAITNVSSERAKLGAVQNRLEHTIKNLDTSAENLQASESRIRDVDMAKEMMNFTKNNILQQAAQAMLAQANQAPQGVLQLLR